MNHAVALGVLAAVMIAGAVPAWPHGGQEIAGPAQAPPARLDVQAAIATSQDAIGRVVEDRGFVDRDGTPIRLADLRGRPVVVSMIYTSCDHICPLITQRLRRAMEDAQRVLGADRFAAVTVGFDSQNDTPARMALYARAQGIDLTNWHALSGTSDDIAGLARDVGFTYVAAAGGFEHVAQVTILDAQGRVYRQIYGDDFPLQQFMEPLKELVFGKVATFASAAGVWDRVRFLCTVYDPNSGRYRISYAIVMSLVTGIISLGGTGFVIARAWIRSSRA